MTHEERERETIDRLRAYQEFRARERETVRRLQEYCWGTTDKVVEPAACDVKRPSSRMMVIDLDRTRSAGSLEDALQELIGTR